MTKRKTDPAAEDAETVPPEPTLETVLVDPETGEILHPGDPEGEPTPGADTAEPPAEEPEVESEVTKEPEIFVVDISEDKLTLEAKTLSGDLRDGVLSWFRQARKPWEKMNAGEQREFSNAIDRACRTAVEGVVEIVTSYDFPSCPVTLGEVKIKGEKGIEAKITAPNYSEYREVLGDHVGMKVAIVMADPDLFMGERRSVRIDPDQRDLPLEPETPDPVPAPEGEGVEIEPESAEEPGESPEEPEDPAYVAEADGGEPSAENFDDTLPGIPADAD